MLLGIKKILPKAGCFWQYLQGSLSATPLQFFYQLAQLLSEAIHRALEAGQQVEGHDDGKANGGYGRQDGLFHGRPHQAMMLVSSTDWR